MLSYIKYNINFPFIKQKSSNVTKNYNYDSLISSFVNRKKTLCKFFKLNKLLLELLNTKSYFNLIFSDFFDVKHVLSFTNIYTLSK